LRKNKHVLVSSLVCLQDIPVIRCYLNTKFKVNIFPNLTGPPFLPFFSF